MIKIEKLNPFGRMCISLGMLPSSYKESLTYEEQLLWFMNYLENTVIPTVNNNADAVEELQTLFTELQSYVDNYFQNIDIQEEINNKLDEMVEDGSLQELLAVYFRDLENTYNERYDELETETDNRYNSILSIVSQMNQKLDATTSGSPSGTYDTLEDLQTADPDHDKIYLVLSNGNWYYYNTTLTDWSSGGVYQSTIENYDTTLTGNNEVPNSKSIGDKINNYYYKDNYFEAGSLIDNKYYNGAGVLTDNNDYYCTSNPIHLNNGDSLYFQYDGQNVNNLITHVIYCDNLGRFISRANQTSGLLTATEDCFVLFNFQKNASYPDYLTLSSFSINQPALGVPSVNYKSVNNDLSLENEKSISDVTKQHNYFDYDNSFINGNIQSIGVYLKRAQNDYFTTNLIKCKSGDVFRCYYFGTTSTNYVFTQVCKYNSNKQWIERSSVNNKTYTCDFNGYLRFNCPKGASDLLDGYFLISKNETVTKYYPYKKFLVSENEKDVKITKQDANNYLINFGKFSVILFKTDDNSNNLHNWNLKEIKNGENIIVPTGTDILGPVKINDDDDFIGGIHGDETTNSIALSIDGSSYGISEVNELSGNNLSLLMKSSVYEEGSETKAFDRYITINISNNKIHVSCNYKAAESLTLKRATNGGLIACQNPIINSIMFNNAYYTSAPTTSQNIGSKSNTEATINTIYGSVTVRNIKGYENENYMGHLNVFTNESPVRNKIYFDTYKQGSYSLSSGDIISGEFEYIFS